MGPAVLIIAGILFLIQENSRFEFGETWPVLLIVIGMFLFAAHNAPTADHVQPWWAGGGQPNQDLSNADQRQKGTDQQVKYE